MTTTPKNTPKPVVLCILDGWGLSTSVKFNAIAQARTPHYDRLCHKYPIAHLKTHGLAVGLPEGQMGNSEVGHTNIGAGRVVWMDLPRIDSAIKDLSLGKQPELVNFITKLKKTGGTAHLLGLISPGGVHAHQRHIAALACILSLENIPVRIHGFLDGRDTPPSSGQDFVKEFNHQISGLKNIHIATLSGRFFAMDRDRRWERIEKAYRAIMFGQGRQARSIEDTFLRASNHNETDEFITPTVLPEYTKVLPEDGILMANFRTDRAREIMSALVDPAFNEFDVHDRPQVATCLGMVEYSATHSSFMDAIFPQDSIKNTLGEWVSIHGKTQLRLAETEKYPHVTFFMNGGVEIPYIGEDRIMATSPKVKTYDLKPEMAAEEICAHLVKSIENKTHDLIIVNFANPDMVGHTGDLLAAIKAVETVDTALGKAVKAIEAAKGAMIITADHGNCEVMRDPLSGIAHTAHTTNPVPIFLVDGSQKTPPHVNSGTLCDLAPTILDLMNIEAPTEMTGVSLIGKME